MNKTVEETIEILKEKYLKDSEVCMGEFLASEFPKALSYEEAVQVYASLMNWADNDVMLRTNVEEEWTENITTGETLNFAVKFE